MKLASRLSVRWKGLLLVSIPLSFQLLFFAAFACLIERTDGEFDRQLESQSLLIGLQNIESGLAGTMMSFGATVVARKNIPDATFVSIKEQFTKLDAFFNALALKRPQYSDAIKDGRDVLGRAEEILPRLKELFGEKSLIPPTKRFKYIRSDLYDLFSEALKSPRKLLDREEALQVTFPETGEQLVNYIGIACLLGIGANLILAVLFARSFSNDFVSRLRLVARNAELIAMERPLVSSAGGDDEIKELDIAVKKAALMLEESRLRERAVLEHATRGMFSIDANLRIASYSKPIERLFQMKEDDLLGLSLIELVEASQSKEIADLGEKAVKQGAGGQIEVTIVRGDKVPFPCLLAFSPSEDGKHSVCVAHDISEKKAVERLRQQFLSMISHDIRTPLASTSSALQLITLGVKGEIRDDVKDRLLSADATVQRLTGLVQDILDIERLESGTIAVEGGCLSTYDLLEESLDRTGDLAARLGVTISKRYKDFPVVADDRWTVEALVNLLERQMRAMAGGSTLAISTREGDEYVEILFQSEGTIHGGDVAESGSEASLSMALAVLVIEKLGGKVDLSAPGKAAKLQASPAGRGASVCLRRFVQDGDT